MSILPVGIGSSATGYSIANSLRFRSSASARLARTFGSAGNAKTWTLSAWIKRGTLGTQQMILSSGVNGVAEDIVFFTSADKLEIQKSWTTLLVTNAVFRDPSAWMHLLIYSDTTQAAAGDRLRIYINGVEASYGTDNRAASLAQNSTWTYFNTARQHGLAYREAYSTLYLDGYLADLYWIDGYKTGSTVATYSDFGETNADGVWVPKKYTGTYGTNGFWLPFSDGTSATTLGYDQAGSNDWTPSGISTTAGVTYDWMTDTPTNNYAVLNPLDNVLTLSEANLKAVSNGSTINTRGSFFFDIGTTDAWYWEVISIGGSGNEGAVGIAPSTYPINNTSSPVLTGNTKVYCPNGTKNYGTAYGSSFTTNDVVSVAVKNGKIWYAKNGVWQASGDPATEANPADSSLSGLYAPFMYAGTNGVGAYYNFGQRPWSYSAPTGFKPLATSNLPTVAITNPKKHFDVKTYSGTGSTQSISSLSFQPDFLWFKSRGQSYSHALFDAVRGRAYGLNTDGTGGEATSSAGNDLASFDSTGFTLGAVQNWNSPNNSLSNPVVWAWKANGAGVTNTSGTITSTVSANTTAGFSIVTYTGTLSASGTATVGHGLGATPKLIITRSKNVTGADTGRWCVRHSDLTSANYYLSLNTTDAQTNSSGNGSMSSPSSTVFSTNFTSGMNCSGNNYVAYCFAEVPGFSKFGSYTGNGSADGPFVFCGFRPRWVMVKQSSAGTTSWWIVDTATGTYNVMSLGIQADSSNAESSGNTWLDVTANGFKIRTTSAGNNTSGSTYIYAAFAEFPNGSNVAPAPAR